MGTEATPYIMLEFGQIYSVRTLEPGEHERVRVKPNDAKRVLQLAYEEGGRSMKLNNPEEFVSLYVCMYVCVCMYVYIYVHIYVCMYILYNVHRRAWFMLEVIILLRLVTQVVHLVMFVERHFHWL